MVEPTDVVRVTGGIAGKTKGDDLMNFSPQAIFSQVMIAVGEVGSDLPAESVLGSQNQVRLVAVFIERPNCTTGNGEMSALDKRNVRSDGNDSLVFHIQSEIGQLYTKTTKIKSFL
jgi:hypothetical protein